MAADRCDLFQLQLSVAHDEDRPASEEVREHMAACSSCAEFAAGLMELDARLARGSFDMAPDLASEVVSEVTGRGAWRWQVAAVAAVGLLIGALVGALGSRFDSVEAQDLGELYHNASPSLPGLTAQLLVVERNWHPEVPERVYTGSLEYRSPEELSIQLIDTTRYPDEGWTPNDVSVGVADGDFRSVSLRRCPTAAMPDCLGVPAEVALRQRRPFDPGLTIPLEIVGPGRSLTWWSGIHVVATPELNGTRTIQIESTVAAVDLLRAITDNGAWRDLHPTDRVLVWLDKANLVPVRVEVFATDSPERDLWQIRHGYADDRSEPIFIVELNEIEIGSGEVEVVIPAGTPTAGFIDRPIDLPSMNLDSGFMPHRTGVWHLPDGGEVKVATWSDGRSWIMLEVTEDWGSGHLFGVPVPFVTPIDLGEGSIGYLEPGRGAVAIHTADTDILISGSLSESALRNAASSLGVRGLAVPVDWAEANQVDIDDLPAGTLIPDANGWSIVARTAEDGITILLTGSGRRTVQIHQTPGSRLGPPTGPDFTVVGIRGTEGRYDASTGGLEWTEENSVLQLRSDTVSLAELIDIAEGMTSK